MAINLKKKAQELLEQIHKKDLTHLNSMSRGDHIIIYSQHEEEREYRCRFTYQGDHSFSFSMYNHNGQWESTPLTGTLEELLEIVDEEFNWVLESY